MHVEGIITLSDGSTSTFVINEDGTYVQSSNSTERLGRTVDVVQGMASALYPHLEADNEREEESDAG